MSSSVIKTISPVDGSVVVERNCNTPEEITSILQHVTTAFKQNKRTPLSRRIAIANKFLDLLAASKDSLVSAPGAVPDG
jgi:acyl-CoA reductase-like NAD-dependent aldehyde dehydrogenase